MFNFSLTAPAYWIHEQWQDANKLRICWYTTYRWSFCGCWGTLELHQLLYSSQRVQYRCYVPVPALNVTLGREWTYFFLPKKHVGMMRLVLSGFTAFQNTFWLWGCKVKKIHKYCMPRFATTLFQSFLNLRRSSLLPVWWAFLNNTLSNQLNDLV